MSRQQSLGAFFLSFLGKLNGAKGISWKMAPLGKDKHFFGEGPGPWQSIEKWQERRHQAQGPESPVGHLDGEEERGSGLWKRGRMLHAALNVKGRRWRSGQSPGQSTVDKPGSQAQ